MFQLRGLLGALLLSADLGAAQLTLSWNDNSDNEDGFKIERSTDGSAYAQVATVAANVTSYVDTSLSASTTYWFRVRAYNSAGDSPYSNIASTTTAADPLPSNTAPTISNISNRSINEDASTGAISFTIGDAETSSSSLTLSATSSNTTLVPQSAIAFGGSGSSRTVTVTPAANQSGSATITVTVSDGALSTSDSFVLTVNAVNDAPTITNITNRTINEDTSTGAINFTIGDAETPASGLTLSATSSNTTLVPQSAIVFGGSGTSRTVTVTPAANQSGSATISITVSDGALSASESFVLTVNAVNDAPTISNITNRSINEDTSTGAISFTIGDAETSSSSLTLSATSSNTTLVPQSGIVFGGSGSSRTVTITPAANQNGSATISITVSDGALSASESFVLTVNAVNDAPTISNVGNRTLDPKGSTTIAFSVSDEDVPASSLVVTGTSSDTSVIPNSAIVFGGGGSSRTVTITAGAKAGSTTITLTVTDGSLSASDTFVLTVNATNEAPTISAIADQTIEEDTPSAAIPFTIGDSSTPAGSLDISVTSSNPTLIPVANVTLGGSGADRTVAVTPAADQNGQAAITVHVSDGSLTSTQTFTVTVTPVEDAPTISEIANVDVEPGNVAGPISFQIGDAETPAANLMVTTSSSNASLVPASGISLGGSGASRTLTITPKGKQTGSATITVSVDDGTITTRSTFVLSVLKPKKARVLRNRIASPDEAAADTGFTSPDARLLNLSARVVCGTGDNVAIPGFVITGETSKRLLLRAVGPTLADFGVTQVLPNPRLTVKRWNGTSYEDFAANDDWNAAADPKVLRQTSTDLYAFGLREESHDAALLVDLPPGQYTIVVEDPSAASGVAIVEIYDADPAPGGAKLSNLSTRGFVGSGEAVMIAGFVVSAESPQDLLVRAVGPALAGLVPGALADPVLELYRRNADGTETLVLSNDNWLEDIDAAFADEAREITGATPLTLESKDAALAIRVPPGIYTAVVRGANGSTGIALVEVYVIPEE